MSTICQTRFFIRGDGLRDELAMTPPVICQAMDIYSSRFFVIPGTKFTTLHTGRKIGVEVQKVCTGTNRHMIYS